MKVNTYSIRNGFDKEKCLVHARCCYTPKFMIATAQYLNLAGSDLFTGLLMSQSFDEGKTWSEFKPQSGLAPITEGEITTVGCDATPLFHNKTGKVLLLGISTEYKPTSMHPEPEHQYTFYSVFDEEKNEFSKMRFLSLPEGYELCGNGCGQSYELENGDLLIPVYHKIKGQYNFCSLVLKCSFDGETLKLLEIGKPLTVEIERGLYEPSVIFHQGKFYLTMRNDEAGYVAESNDGLNYSDLQLWKWKDGSILQSYNTQQHWLKVGDDLYLTYTRRGAENDHVFRHRAPIFISKVENMRLLPETERAIIPEKGARLGNFGCAPFKDGRGVVMAAEWMQPVGCEKMGSDNNIYISFVE